MKKSLCGLLATLSCLFIVDVFATPFQQSFTLAGGAGTYTIDSVYNDASTGARIEAIAFASATNTTATIRYTVGGITNVAGTKVVHATDRVYTVTNIPALFKGDKIVITTTDTATTNTSYIVGDEF